MKPHLPVKKGLRVVIVAVAAALAVICTRPAGAGRPTGSASLWQQLEPGLELGIFPSPRPADVGDSLIRVLRIDPERYRFHLVNASADKNVRLRTARQWSRKYGLSAAINASMYQTDYKTSVSLMRTTGHVNNPRLSRDMAILGFDRRQPDIPHVKIIDRQCDDFDTWKTRYGTLVQSIRMISCTGKNVWTRQDQKWSTAAVASDRRDRILFIYVASPYRTHDLINILKMLPIGIDRAMYVEGGPQAQLYINAGGKEHEYAGGYEISGQLMNADSLNLSGPIPNVIGIAPKDAPVR
jgi:hypothetical protein